MARYSHLSQPDPEWLKVASVLPTPAPPTDMAQFRKDAIAFRKLLYAKQDPPITTGLTVTEKEFSSTDSTIAMRTYVPQPEKHLGEETTHLYPVLFWTFGGGFCVGSLDDDDTVLRSLTVKLRISCVSVDYRKTPEFPFPTGLNDCYAGLKWTAANTNELHGDLNKGFIVGGLSSGSNFTATMVQRASKDPDLKGKLTGHIHIMPPVLHPRAQFDKYRAELLSMEQNKNAAFLNAEWLHRLFDMCSAPNPSDPEISPVLAPTFAGLPPAYIQLCGLDPLRDEGFLYDRLLREAGVPTKVDVYPGVPHGFHVYFPELEGTHKQRRSIQEGLAWLLQSR